MLQEPHGTGLRENQPAHSRVPHHADNGEQYYLDSYGTVIPRSGYAAHLPVVTGHVTQKNAASLLVELGRCLQNDPFWNSQVEQVNITPDGELEMVHA